MRKQNQKRKIILLDNSGSTFIVVMVAVGFLMVLATIILAVSTANVRMKQVEYVAKQNFYTDEIVLDDIYHGIGKVSSDFLSKSYVEVLAEIEVLDDAGIGKYPNQQAAFDAFSTKFVDRLKDHYGENGRPLNEKAEAYLQSYITLPDSGTVSSIEVEDNGEIEIINDAGIPYQYVFRDVMVKYLITDGGARNGYEATITTDIVVEVPYINFFQDTSRILDYALVSNEGIYFRDGERDVYGNVYAGISQSETTSNLQDYRDVGVYGGLNFYNAKTIFESNYLISKGDINVHSSDLTIGNTQSMADTQVWAESIRTVEDENYNTALTEGASTIDITGNMYVANDLELNARGSEVALSGAYYGYNTGRLDGYKTWESKGERAAKYTTKDHTNSSAMIINGKNSVLDISKLNTMIIAGVAYIDMASKAYNATTGQPNELVNPVVEYATGESLALKANQYMYLAPASCLTTTNPVKAADAPPLAEVWPEGTMDTWFGFSFGSYVDKDHPIIERDVLNRATGVTYRYYYLNFPPGKQEEYASFILNMQDPENLGSMDSDLLLKYQYDKFTPLQQKDIWNIKKSLQGRVDATGVEVVGIDNIYIPGDETTAKIYTRGTMVRVSGTAVDNPLVPEENLLSADYIASIDSNLHKHYIHLYESLNAKESISLTSNPGDIEPSDFDEWGKNTLPASYFVDFTNTGLKSAGSPTPPSYRDSHYKTVIATGNAPDVTTNFEGIIICGGDVTIQNGASVKGLIIAGGKIYIQGNGKIEASRSVVQTILNEEMREESKKKDATEANKAYAITYLKDIKFSYSGTDNTHRISGTDYTEYMSYANWRKGEIE